MHLIDPNHNIEIRPTLCLVQKHGKPGVIVMSARECENLRDPRKRFSSQAEWDKFFEFVDTVKARMSEKSHADLQKIIDEEVQAVRAK